MSMRVLIVDDDPTNLEVMAALVDRIDGCTAVRFDDPLAALGWLRDHEPDLMLVDHMMPGLDGVSMIGILRDDPRFVDVPIVMVTANRFDELRVEALERGATDFIEKPVRIAELKARVRNLLALRRSQCLLRDRAALLAEEVARATADIRDREMELVMRLCRAAEFRDPETGAHIERMARYSELIAEGLGLAPSFCREIRLAAPMHDMGKIGIPDMILLKPGRLNEAELQLMRQHATIGHSILAGSRAPLMRLGASIALSHHEKWDGSGYPNGSAGTDIPLAGRIVAVADVFDALSSARPYKEAWSRERARDAIESGSGTHFDPSCVEAFLKQWDGVVRIQDAIQDPAVPVECSPW